MNSISPMFIRAWRIGFYERGETSFGFGCWPCRIIIVIFPQQEALWPVELPANYDYLCFFLPPRIPPSASPSPSVWDSPPKTFLSSDSTAPPTIPSTSGRNIGSEAVP